MMGEKWSYRDKKNSAIREARSIEIVGMGEVVVAIVRTIVVDRVDALIIQLRVEDPSFPALSRAVTRTIKVPEESCGTVRV